MSDSQDGLLLASRLGLVFLTTVEGALYGLMFTLYTFCARSLYLQLGDRDRRRQRLFTLLYMSLLMALALCNLAADAQNALTSYVDNADFPGGGYNYSLGVFGKSPVGIMSYVAAALLEFMTSGIQIWRLWIVWRASRYALFIVITLALTLLAYLALEAVSIVMPVAGQPEWTLHLRAIIFYGEIIFPLCITATITLLITGRIAVVRRKHIKIMGKTDSSSLYTSVISILIESFALESVWLIGELSGATGFPTYNPVIIAVNSFFWSTLPFIEVLAYLLVVYQVAMGREWKEDTAEKLTALQWNRDGSQTTQIGTRASTLMTREEA